MISSTATDIELELIDSYKIVYSLQDLCFLSISQAIRNERNSPKNDKYDSLPLAKRLINHLKEYY